MPTQTAAPKKSVDKKAPPMNLFTGIGRLGQEPVMRYSADGRAWCKTSLAIFQGEDKDPIWLQIKAFAKPLDAGGWDESVPVALAETEEGPEGQRARQVVLRQARLQRQGIRRLGSRVVQRPDDRRRRAEVRSSLPATNLIR